MDEIFIWRESAHRFCFHHEQPDRFDALPSWAKNPCGLSTGSAYLKRLAGLMDGCAHVGRHPALSTTGHRTLPPKASGSSTHIDLPHDAVLSHFRASFSRTYSRGRNSQFTATAGSVSVYRAPQMVGAGHADVLVILQVPGNNADAVPGERLPCYR